MPPKRIRSQIPIFFVLSLTASLILTNAKAQEEKPPFVKLVRGKALDAWIAQAMTWNGQFTMNEAETLTPIRKALLAQPMDNNVKLRGSALTNQSLNTGSWRINSVACLVGSAECNQREPSASSILSKQRSVR